MSRYLREGTERRWTLIAFHFDMVFGAYGVNRIFAFVYKVLHVLLELLYVFRLCQFEGFELLIDAG